MRDRMVSEAQSAGQATGQVSAEATTQVAAQATGQAAVTLSAGERLEKVVMALAPQTRARLSRSSVQVGYALELEELLIRSGLGWLRGAARDRVLDLMVSMCAHRRGALRDQPQLHPGLALAQRDREAGNESGKRALSRLSRSDAMTLSHELARLATVAGVWKISWGPLFDLAIRWDDPERRAALVRRMQLTYIGRPDLISPAEPVPVTPPAS